MGALDGLWGHLVAIATGLRYLVASKRMTVHYPEYVIRPRDGYRGMIRWHKDKCISCSLCARICPASAIKMYRKPGEKKAYPGINYQRCIFCGFCVDICPADALEHTVVHDIAFASLDEHFYIAEDFDRDWESPAVAEGASRVRVEFDERRGLVHVPGD